MSCSFSDGAAAAMEVACAVDARLSELRSRKVKVKVKGIGNAPLLQKELAFFTIDGSKRFAELVDFLKKMLKLDSKGTLHVYVSDSFEPLRDEIIDDLYRCFGGDSLALGGRTDPEGWCFGALV